MVGIYRAKSFFGPCAGIVNMALAIVNFRKCLSLVECGVNFDHATIYCWVQRYAPEIEKRLRWYWRNPTDLSSWHIDETYVT